MKILLATYWLLPHQGGVWPFMEKMRSSLEQLGHEVEVLGSGDNGSSVYVLNQQRKIRKADLLPLLQAKLNTPYYASMHKDSWVYNVEVDRLCYELALAYLDINHYDVIHSHDLISTYAISRVRKRNVPVITTIHGSITREVRLTSESPNFALDKNSKLIWDYYPMIEHLGAMVSHYPMTPSQWMKDIMVNECSVAPDRITVVPYGYDIHDLERKMLLPTPIQRPQNKKVMITPARLTQVKGIHVLLKALHKLKSVRDDWHCWIVGDGELREVLEKQMHDYGLQQQVQFLGFRDDVPALLAQSDIFVLPSIHDNQPLSVIEAQLAGKPVIVSSGGGLPEMVSHLQHGMVFPTGNSDVLADQMNILLEHEELRRLWGHNGKEWGSSNWSMDLMNSRFINVYNALLKH
ncbi:glycosyltransferase family 4 protein [Paenibacillus sp. N1-5-1-14]|uniref:glycosyltransferase family 4 protein n=1 Tax=Paenibacillus radicibacter TaxID=2972488 RepID=UPI0021591E53|nr:glycosyltransferase family 4 protein [Paenibacillus radicibacter]MCR8645187.1 glycosyltransferase family 4 protein [Paenibacillus radicibacter]